MQRVLATVRRPIRFLQSGAAAAAVLLGAAPAAAADDAELMKRLNAPLVRVTEASKSANRLFTAYLDMTKPPKALEGSLAMADIWPGMTGWADVAKWAEANPAVGKALVEVQNCLVIGVPYGTAGVDPKFIERGLFATVGTEGAASKGEFPYLKALAEINAYAVAEMYRRCEAGSFDDAFKVGIAHLRVLRQACDASMYDEKLAAMQMLCEAFSVHRDVIWSYKRKIGVDRLKNLSLNEYPFLKATDNERMKRLEMPEGDRIVAEFVIGGVFVAGQPDEEKFSATFAELQALDEPLTGFGAAKRWQMIASKHGSLEASLKKLNGIYDDWWRRWRMRQYDPMQSLPTELSRTNPVKYAAVALSARDISQMFEMRRRMIVESAGTVLGCGLAAYMLQFEDWPNDIEKAYAVYIPKRFDFDPYDRDYGRMRYEFLDGREKSTDSEFGRVSMTGCVLYARNGDNEFNGAGKHFPGGATGDFIVWPPLRALSRGQGGE
ncbi:MAG: hypothetical protein ACKOYN_07855 [Planctomycetota bacterium]